MAAPLAVVAQKIAQKFAIDLLSDPEKTLKTIGLVIFVPLFLMFMIFALPVVLMLNLPSLLFGGSSTPPEVQAKQLATIAIYSKVPETINKETLKWLNEQKAAYSWCDDIVIKSNGDLSWQQLMAIDAVKLDQDYYKANEEEVRELGRNFSLKLLK